MQLYLRAEASVNSEKPSGEIARRTGFYFAGVHLIGLPRLEPHLHHLPPEVFDSKMDFLTNLVTPETCWELANIPHHVSHARPVAIMVVQNLGGLASAAGLNGLRLAL